MKTVNVRIKYGGQITNYDCVDVDPSLDDWVVVKNGDLTYMGLVVSNPVIWPTCAKADSGGCSIQQQWLRDHKLIRVANAADLASQAENQLREQEAFEYCLSRVAVQNLDMKLVAVETVFDGSKTIFYYTAEERVDFRLLVKELVSRFRTRIEMRQIGVRHEAKMVGGLGSCGQSFCCCGFLDNFVPVSVKMAKEQNIALSPAKISGVCGRLMCCLAFEHSEYAVQKNNQDDGGSQDQNQNADEESAALLE